MYASNSGPAKEGASLLGICQLDLVVGFVEERKVVNPALPPYCLGKSTSSPSTANKWTC